MRKLIIAVIAGASLLTAASAASAQDAQDAFNQNMNNANQAYQYQQQQQNRQQMQQYQDRAGTFNPGPLDRPVGNNTYVSPSYNNGAPGVTVTHTYR
jgi:Ni/Co efflux regulator RcnB